MYFFDAHRARIFFWILVLVRETIYLRPILFQTKQGKQRVEYCRHFLLMVANCTKKQQNFEQAKKYSNIEQ